MSIKVWARVTMLSVVILAAGCSTRQTAVDEKRSMYVTQHPEMEPNFARAVLAGNVLVGMDESMVAAAWGEPTRSEKLSVSNAKGDTKWIYGNYLVNNAVTHLYFKDNKVVLYEFVDTQTQSTQAISDPNEKLSLLPQPPSELGGGGSKGGP